MVSGVVKGVGGGGGLRGARAGPPAAQPRKKVAAVARPRRRPARPRSWECRPGPSPGCRRIHWLRTPGSRAQMRRATYEIDGFQGESTCCSPVLARRQVVDGRRRVRSRWERRGALLGLQMSRNRIPRRSGAVKAVSAFSGSGLRPDLQRPDVGHEGRVLVLLHLRDRLRPTLRVRPSRRGAHR